MAKKVTLSLDEQQVQALRRMLQKRGIPQSAILTRALKPKSMGAGRSGRGDLSERAEKLLEGLGEDEQGPF